MYYLFNDENDDWDNARETVTRLVVVENNKYVSWSHTFVVAALIILNNGDGGTCT
jgi:hypothetical protein